jgi:hypothetical protein
MSTEEATRAQAEQKSGEPSNKLTGTAHFREVREQELSEIKVRRSRAQLTDADQSPGDNLVGLALSGGGIRSAAFSLGVVHALGHRGVMPFIDYLSTVSGGGYAGAFLSSYLLGARKNWRQFMDERSQRAAREPSHAPEKPAAEAAKTQPSRISSVAQSVKFPERMLQFLFGGNYLRRTWVFFNRYLIGLLLIWAVTFSGLIAAASGIAYVFRTLDDIDVRSWLAVIGFDGDIRLAFFLTFVLLVIWLAAWGISYFRSLARAEGHTARYVFYFVVITALVASASLLLSGHIALNHGKDAESFAAGSTARTLWTVVISAIGASLIPYLSPKSLLRSGTNPQNSAEKYTFWIASRALVYGVPFLVVAHFAQENISGYNAERDSRLAFSEILNWDSAYAPLFLRIEDEWKQTKNAKKAPESIFFLSGRKTEDAPKELPGHFLHNDCVSPAEFSELDRRFHQYYAWLLANDANNIARREKNELGADSATLSLSRRWWHLLEHCLNGISRGSSVSNPTLEMVNSRNDVIDQKKEILNNLNLALGKSNLYQQFESGVDGLDADRKKAIEPLLKKARGLDASLDEPKTASADSPSGTTGVTDKSQLLAEEDRRRAILDVNRALLAAYYPNTISDRDTVYSSVVLGHDQDVRLRWFLIAGCVFLVLGTLVDLNATSWHAFYSRQMANMWIEPVSGGGEDGREIALARLATVESGWPYHLISGSLQLFGRRRTSNTKSERQSFLFSELYCGADVLRYAPTKKYMGGEYTLADAIAISGAAVSPIQSRNPLVTALLFIFNIRLGQWVANPSYASRLPKWLADFVAGLPFTPLRMLCELGRNAEDRPHCFVTDGGHYENLGIEPLLKRRCRLIIASDAGQDGNYEFADLMRLIRWARINEGIEVRPVQKWEKTLNIDSLIPDQKTNLSSKHFIVAEIRYPEDGDAPSQPSYLVYLKSSLCKDDPCELLNYRRIHTQFPHDDTSDQFYDPERFFCYWQLGKHIAEQACGKLGDDFADEALSTAVDDFIDRFVGIRSAKSKAGSDGPEADKPPAAAEPPVPAPTIGPVSSARPMDEGLSGVDRSVRDNLRQLDPSSNASEAAMEWLVANRADVFRYLGRYGLEGLSADAREMVLGSLLKVLLDSGTRVGVVGRRALERLTADIVASADTEADSYARGESVECLSGILQLANGQGYLKVAHQIKDKLAQLSSDDPDPNVRRLAKACLK